jgi:hypothetical protein
MLLLRYSYCEPDRKTIEYIHTYWYRFASLNDNFDSWVIFQQIINYHFKNDYQIVINPDLHQVSQEF